MPNYNFSNEPFSVSMLAKSFFEFDIKRDQVLAFLIEKGYVEDIRTATDFGLANGVSYKYNDSGSKWPVYDIQIQKLILDNIETVKQYGVLSTAYTPKPLPTEGAVITPYCSITAFAKNNGISNDTANRVLAELGYIIRREGEKTFSPTDLGVSKGIDVGKNKRGFKMITYPADVQKEVLTKLGITDIIEIVDEPKDDKKLNIIDIAQKSNVDFDGVILEEYPNLKIKDFVIIDTETTGISRDDEIIEFAVVDIYGEVLYESTFNPMVMINPSAAMVNGLTNESLTNSPLFKDEWQKIRDAIGNKRLLGHNLSFDKRLTAQTLERYGIDSQESNDLFKGYYDSMRIAKKHIDAKSYSLENLAHMVGINRVESHRAADDCIMTLEFLNRLEIILNNQ